jgi:hypothetical protein
MEVNMKKIFILPLILLFCGSAFAFDVLSYPPPVQGKDLQFDIVAGFTKTGRSLRIPPLAVNVEYALPTKAPISIGVLVAFYQTGKKDEGWTYVSFGGRANWHWAFPVNLLDFYTGIFVGYKYASWDGPSNLAGPDGNRFAIGGQIGAHFYVTKGFGLVVEFGYPFLAKAGLAFKF